VFESQADWVAAGQAAEARLEYMPGSEFSGQVDYVYPVLDPATRTLRVRLRFDNPNERLKPNMYARVSIYGRLKPNALTIPREALILAPGRDRVVVALGEGRFHVQEVLTGLESGEFVEILAGISEGDDVVTSAQFLIDSEASLAGSIQRLDSIEKVPGQRQLGKVFASGRVENVDSAKRRIRILHGPIDALGWPSMDMVFDVQPGVDLAGIRAGQVVQFVLVQGKAGEYLLQQIHADEEDGATGTAVPERSAETGKSPAAEDTVTARATVRGIDESMHTLRLQHDPIEVLGWPSMTMTFAVDPDVDISSLLSGQRIHFSMSRDKEGSWVIRQIHAMDDGAGVESQPSGAENPEGSGKDLQAPAEDETIMAGAVVRGIDTDKHSLRLQHDPIEQLGWPSMTMSFQVDPGLDIGSLRSGQRIHFSMSRDSEGAWVIRQIHVMDKGAGSGESGHD